MKLIPNCSQTHQYPIENAFHVFAAQRAASTYPGAGHGSLQLRLAARAFAGADRRVLVPSIVAEMEVKLYGAIYYSQIRDRRFRFEQDQT
jgi:hypothetical protein